MKYYTPRFLLRRYQIIKRIKGGHRFLEIGPGSFNLTEDILKHFSKGTLIDYNPYLQEIYDNLEPSIKNNLQFIIEDFMAFQIELKYECIVACEVMEHVEQDRKFLQKVYKLLNNHGQTIISVPARWRYWAKDDEIVGHFKRYEKKEIIEMLLRENFKNVSVISYGFPFINILRWPRILLANMQAKKKEHLSKETLSKHSGVSSVRWLMKLLRIFCNPYTIYPLCLISSLFNGYDLSDGYIITAEK